MQLLYSVCHSIIFPQKGRKPLDRPSKGKKKKLTGGVQVLSSNKLIGLNQANTIRFSWDRNLCHKSCMGDGEINQIPRKEISLEQRVARLEGRLGWRREEFILQPMALRAILVLLPLSLILAYLGLGLPNHYYQVLFSVLSIALIYHRGLFARPKNILHWLIVMLNIIVFSLLLKLFIGAGRAQPLAWIKVPTLEATTDEAKEQWLQVLPQLKFRWDDSAVSTWIIDLTQVQTFFLLLTLVGGLFNFQPFVSFTAILLIFSSIPAFLTFRWEWVFPAIITASIAFYLQTASANLE